MRILHYVPALSAGGVANVWINLTKTLAKLNQKVYLICPFIDSLNEFVNLYERIRTPPQFIQDPLHALIYAHLNKHTVLKVVKHENVDVILTHGPLYTYTFSLTYHASL